MWRSTIDKEKLKRRSTKNILIKTGKNWNGFLFCRDKAKIKIDYAKIVSSRTNLLVSTNH